MIYDQKYGVTQILFSCIRLVRVNFQVVNETIIYELHNIYIYIILFKINRIKQ